MRLTIYENEMKPAKEVSEHVLGLQSERDHLGDHHQTMKAVLLRICSSPVVPGSPLPGTLSVQAAIAATSLRQKRLAESIRSDPKWNVTPTTRIRREVSENAFPGGSHVLPEVEGSVVLEQRRWDRVPASEELGFQGSSGGGGSAGCRNGGDFESNSDDRRKIGAYYEQMLKSNPTDSLLLGNYAKFLHQIEKDGATAEEYYGRAILASPGDGEVLSLYGSLIWEKDRDESRAKDYLDRAVHASPHDCTVLGSYARFMWDVGQVEEDDDSAESAVGAPPEVSEIKS